MDVAPQPAAFVSLIEHVKTLRADLFKAVCLEQPKPLHHCATGDASGGHRPAPRAPSAM